MLSSFGLYWIGEGAGIHWPGSDLAIPVLVGFFAAVTAATVAWMRTLAPAPAEGPGTQDAADERQARSLGLGQEAGGR
jgi:hypothetical protein